MPWRLHRSERSDSLVGRLADVLSQSTDDPFTPDVVAVPARGVERWLNQRLAHALGATDGTGDGVSANIRFPSPSGLVDTAVTAAIDIDDDPWTQTTWRLLHVIDASLDEPWCAPLARHLAGGQGRRLATSQRLSGLFASYGSQRPAMVRDWRAGRDTDGSGTMLSDDLTWQAELWRRLRTAIGIASPAERLEDVCRRLREEPEITDLPPRLSVFGPTRLSTDQVAVMRALAEHRDVHLWLPHPSAALWETTHAARGRRRDDPTRHSVRHPLLASLGRDVREMQQLLTEAGGATTDEHHPAAPPPATLLGRVQAGIRDDEPPPGVPLAGADTRAMLDADDRSVQVHACHGRSRQVEVLREVLLGLLEDDPSLEPRDVLVMCPDIESYAPHISATFGLGGSDAVHPGHLLRVQLADRSLRQTNPLLATIGRLLELADSRVTTSQVLDLAASPPVRRRFRFGDDELVRIRVWVTAAGVRWGLDAAHRAPYRMQRVAQNTWEAGLDRVLLGTAMSEDELHWVGLALPLDDVDSRDIELAGRLSELLDRLAQTLDRLRDDQPLTDWLAALDDALTALTSVSEADGWQLAQARRELARIAEGATEHAGVVLSTGDVHALLADQLRGRPTRAGFRTGDLTMCSMVPMRSVPHRVICLLGLDDGVFPRSTGVDGDDVLARDPLVGERDRRSEDRQLLLDAIMAAREHLVMLYSGADERTNTIRPPAVPVGEMLDVLDATVATRDDRWAREHVVVRHPLQPFDNRNFVAGSLATPGPFSFDRAGLAGARAAARERQQPPPFLTDPLPPGESAMIVDLDTLVRFLEHPVRGFLRQRLGVAAPEAGEELDDSLHAELAGLDTWAVGDRWLRLRLAGAAKDVCEQAEWRRGALPPGALGQATLDKVTVLAEGLLRAGADSRSGAPAVHDVSVELHGGRSLAGTVGGLHGRTLSRTVYSKLAAKHRLRAWVLLLALSTSRPDQAWQAVTVGRAPYDRIRRASLPGVPSAPTDTLADLVALHDLGLREPLPLPLAASLAYADVRVSGDDEQHALEKAAKAWDDAFEGDDRDHHTVWGPAARFRDVLQQRPRDADQPAGTDVRASTRFGALACRLWFPMLRVQQEETL